MPSIRDLRITLNEHQSSLEVFSQTQAKWKKELSEKNALLERLKKEVAELMKNLSDIDKTVKNVSANVKKTEKEISDKEQDEVEEKESKECREYLHSIIRGNYYYDSYTEDDVEDMLDAEIIKEAALAHFYYVIFPEFKDCYPDSEGRHIIADEEDCVGRSEDDPDYRSCCHKKFATYVYAPGNDTYNPVTIHSTRDNMIQYGRVD